jgi:hypothetical protein
MNIEKSLLYGIKKWYDPLCMPVMIRKKRNFQGVKLQNSCISSMFFIDNPKKLYLSHNHYNYIEASGGDLSIEEGVQNTIFAALQPTQVIEYPQTTTITLETLTFAKIS